MTRFHAIAPISPAKITVVVIAAGSTTSLATVAATSSEMNAPAKLRTAAKATASRGGIARVEIEVATTLAVSWKPLVKSNASAVATTRPRIRSPSLTTRAQAFLMTMPSRMWATDSVASIARSSLRKMSLQRITNIGSIPFANSDATASR